MGGILIVVGIVLAGAIVAVIVLAMVYQRGVSNGELFADETRCKQLESLRLRLRHMTEERDSLLKRILLPEKSNYDVAVSAARFPTGVIGSIADQQRKVTAELRDRLDIHTGGPNGK